MARFIDKSPEEENEDEFSSIEEVEQTVEEAEEPTPEAVEEDDIPDKYRGKEYKDIIRMHQEAEKLLGRQSSEVGELRQIVDDFVKAQTKATSPQQQDEEVDFFADPDKAVARAIENHPKLKEAEQVSVAMRQQTALAQLQANHPDFVDIVQNEKFLEWTNASKFRQDLFTRADKQFDYESANELLTLWKERQSMVHETAKMQETDRKRQLKAASTGKASGSTEAPNRKIYRRADIIKLMKEDPKRYQALSDEIMQAYSEGRVK